MILYRSFGVCSRASLIAASFASVPELQKNACPPKLRSESTWAHNPCHGVCQVFGT